MFISDCVWKATYKFTSYLRLIVVSSCLLQANSPQQLKKFYEKSKSISPK